MQRNTISPPITGRFIQLNPIEWNQENEPDKHDICMRIAFFKCKGTFIQSGKKKMFEDLIIYDHVAICISDRMSLMAIQDE